jgi:transcriptional regulator with XRE-family HTH domain
MNKPRGEGLGVFVARTVKQKNLRVREVEAKAGGKISNAYVSGIMSGNVKNLSLDKLVALANGLEVDVHELVDAALGPPASRADNRHTGPSHTLEVLDLMRRITLRPGLMEIVEDLVRLKPDEREVAHAVIRDFLVDDNPKPAKQGRRGAGS